MTVLIFTTDPQGMVAALDPAAQPADLPCISRAPFVTGQGDALRGTLGFRRGLRADSVGHDDGTAAGFRQAVLDQSMPAGA